jgi:hypothetical protein
VACDPGVVTGPKDHAAVAGIGSYLTCQKADVRFACLRDGENGATAGRVEMSGQSANPVRFWVYAAAAVAGSGTLPDTLLDPRFPGRICAGLIEGLTGDPPPRRRVVARVRS